MSRGMERVTPVPPAVLEMLRDWNADTVQASMLTSDAVFPDCWDGGGTPLYIAILAPRNRADTEKGEIELLMPRVNWGER